MKRSKTQSTEQIEVSVARYIRDILTLITTVYMLLIIVVMPFYNQEGYNHIGSDKSYFFRTCSSYTAKMLLPVLVCYLLCLAINWCRVGTEQGLWERIVCTIKKMRISPTDLFALLYAFSVALSYWGTNYKDTALWGIEGWYMGALPQLILVGIYFCVSRFCRRRQILYLFLPVSAIVFLLGIVNRFGWYPLSMENSGIPSFISTVGNINWYCGYLTAVFFVGAGLFWLTPKNQRLRAGLLALYTAVGFAALVTQGSDSGIFALAVTMLVIFCLSAGENAGGSREKAVGMLRFWQLTLLLSGACLLIFAVRLLLPGRMNYTFFLGDLLTYSMLPAIMAIISAAALLGMRLDQRKRLDKAFRVLARTACIAVPAAVILFAGMVALNTLRPGSLGRLSGVDVFTFKPAWGSNRGATWGAGVQCFLEQDPLRKFIGLGPDCMWDYIVKDGSAELLDMVQNTFGTGNRLTNAHCEWLTILVNTGLLGFVGYGGMMLSAIVRFLRARQILPGAAACGLCLLAYTSNNVWSFQQSMGVASIFVLMGIGESRVRAYDPAN